MRISDWSSDVCSSDLGILCALWSQPGPFMAARTARIERNTRETQIRVEINLDGTGEARLASGIPFPDHMLDQIARPGLIDLVVEAKGAREIDDKQVRKRVVWGRGVSVRVDLGGRGSVKKTKHIPK